MGNRIVSKATVKTSASITKKTPPVEEGLKTHGLYTATVHGPVELFRKPYVWLRDFIASRPNPKKDILAKVARFLMGLIPTEKKWEESFTNTTTYEGRNYMLDTFMAGSSYTAAWYVGLISITGWSSVSVNDTMASHAGWTEDQTYSEAARVAASWAAAASGAKALDSAAVFSINGAGTTIKGCFLTTVSTKGGTTGKLFSAGLFAGGDKVLGNGDTLNVSYSATVT